MKHVPLSDWAYNLADMVADVINQLEGFITNDNYNNEDINRVIKQLKSVKRLLW